MDDDWSSVLSRDDLLGGFPARRASMLLFAIEGRTGQLVSRSRSAMATYISERTAEEQEQSFLDAMAEGRDPPVRPTVQDLERYAPEWASLVPEDPGVRATVARLIGEKYRLPKGRVPGIWAALGLEEPVVRDRFQQLHGRPVDSILAASVPLRERFTWFRATAARRLENLPPFWTAFALTLTETVGAGILALPIAFATVGPVAGVVALVVLGLVNILTITAMAEAVARNGNVRYGRAYFGRLVRDYLGPAGSMILSPALLILNAVVLLTYLIGFSSVLSDALGVRPEVWALGLLATLLIFLRRETLDATVASALLVGACSITIIAFLSVFAFTHVSADNLRHAEVPFRDGRPFDSSVLELVFGVVLLAFFGHTSTANCAAVVLAREPSGRSLIHGSMAALGAAVVLYSIWVVAVGGAVSPRALADESGTALTPLADQVGASINVFGVLFAVLAMGMAAIHVSMGLTNQVKEWLPAAPKSAAAIPAPVFSPVTRFISPLPRFPSVINPSLISLLPVVAIFALGEWLLLTDQESFAGLLGFAGILTAPIVAGIFSMLMLHAARRKGDCAVRQVGRWLDHPATLVVTCGLFLASILVHGVFIWEEPIERAAGVLVTAVVLVFLFAIRASAFVPRAVIELRIDSGRNARPVLNVVSQGLTQPAAVEWIRSGRSGTGGATVQVEALPVRELKLWTHRLDISGVTEGIGAVASICSSSSTKGEQIDLPAGQVIVPVSGDAMRVEIVLSDEAGKAGAQAK